MGSEFLKTPLTHQFTEQFAFYLSIGMTYEQYWEQDCTLTRHYYKAWLMKREQQNYNAWLNGLYVHDAINVVAANVLAKKGSKAVEYHAKPYGFTDSKEEDLKVKQENAQLKAEFWMRSLVQKFNAGGD